MKRTIKGVVASLVATFVLSIMPLSVLAAGDMEINSTNFGSDTFADYLISIEKSTSGCNGDGKFSSDELSLIKSLKPDSSVTRIIGLKAFPNLTTLDVSACTSLTSIIANDTTSLTTLKLGSITNLEYLYAKNTAISSVDVTKCTKLKRIYLSNAPITSIDLSKNRALAEVLLDGTSITSLDISACPNIYNLDISNTGNAIESLDIVNNYLLIRSGVGGTKTTKGNIVSYERTPNGEKRFLRVDKETEVYCSIDEKSVPDEAFRNIVKKFDLDDDDKFSMDELKEVKDVHFNGKYEVASVKGVEMFYNLERLVIFDTKITSLDLKNNPSLTRLTVFTSDITSIDLSKTPLLQYLTLHSDIYVDISNLTELVRLQLSDIKNVELDLSNQPNLKTLMFSSRATKSINLKNNTELESLVLCYTGISQLDLSANTKLDYAEVHNNLLTELDLTNNPNVETVNVSSNPDFQTLKVADNNKINTIYCNGCNITELDLSHLNLHTLHCNDNHISELDLSNQKRLGTLICYNNDIATLNLYGTRLSSSIDSISEQDNKFVSEYQVSIWLTEVFMCDNTVELVGLENFPSTMPTPTETPTVNPTVTPTPTKTPVVTPTVKPTVIPTAVPTATVVPTVSTTPIATVVPTLVPTATGVPTNKPIATVAPTIKPTSTPDVKPSLVPEVTTTVTPSVTPEVEPSKDNGVGGFIERLYTVAMGRDFDEAGKDYWVNEIKVNGQTGAEVALQFLFSDEFLSKDMTEDEFLTILYRTFFDREPEAAGLAYWKGEMQSGKTKEWVIAGFINSPEWANICLTYGIKSGTDVQPTIAIVPNEQVIGFATRLYTTCLGRDFDPEGLDYWARELANLRQSGSEVAKGFFFSPEFVDSKFDDSEYLTRLYKTVMGREPEKDGFNYWMGELKSGNMTRESVFDGFAASPEWIGICADYGILR